MGALRGHFHDVAESDAISSAGGDSAKETESDHDVKPLDVTSWHQDRGQGGDTLK